MPPPRFAADVMLGKLARWLRLGGFDTFYSNAVDDPFLHDLALRETRILLTRDRLLHGKMPEGMSHLVAAEHPQKQLEEIVSIFQLTRWPLPFRCSLCNGALAELSKKEVCDRVPPFVYDTQERFTRCQGCGKIYWPGTHLPRILRTLRAASSSPLQEKN